MSNTETFTPGDVRTVCEAYIAAALWSSSDQSDDQGGIPLDDERYGREALAGIAYAEMCADVRDFLTCNAQLLDGLELESIGHDFWLTRNRHGAGFWDRGLGARGDELTAIAHAYGACDLYVGDDGRIYAS